MTNTEIKNFCNHSGYSDVTPYEVVRIISDQTVEIREMDAERDTNWKPEFHVGGFSAHCANQNEQKWFYKSNENNPIERARFSKARNQWQVNHKDWDTPRRHNMSDTPRKFYDYNF
jgi:hypothetical protein